MLLSFFYLGNIVSQTCVWAKTPNPNSNGSCVACDALGNIYVTGQFSGTNVAFGSYILTSSGFQNIYLAKYNSNGNVLWAQSLAGDGQDWAYGVSVDKSGNVLICGAFSSSTLTLGSFTLSNNGNDDYYIAKYDGNGNALWAKSAGSPSIDCGFSVSSDSYGDVYVVGYTEGPSIAIGSYTLSSPPYTMFFTKYNGLNGNVIWATTANGSALSYGLTIDNHDNIYIGGEFGDQLISFGTHTLSLADPSYSSFFVAQYDRFGNCNWAKSGTNRYVYGMCTNSAGDVFAFGNFFTSTISIGAYTLSNYSSYGNNQFLVRYDSVGNVIWAKSFGSVSDGLGYAVAADETNLYVIGNTGYGGPMTIGNYTFAIPNQGISNPMYFARFDFSGNVVFAKTYNTGGGQGDDQSWLCTDKNKNVYLTGGFSESPMVIDSYSLTSPTGYGSYLVKYHFYDVGIKENAEDHQRTIVFPNPNIGLFIIKLRENKKEENVEISIFDITGRLVLQEHKTVGGSNELPLKNDLQNGMYLVKVKFDDGTYDIHHLIISK